MAGSVITYILEIVTTEVLNLLLYILILLN